MADYNALGYIFQNGNWYKRDGSPAAGGGSGSVAVTPMARWRGALAKMRDGQANAKIAFLGSSTVLGLGNSTRDTSYFVRLKSLLAAKMGPVYTGATFGSGNLNLGATVTFDPRITMSTGWQPNGNNSPVAGFYFMNITNITGLFGFTPGEQFDTIELLVLRDNLCGSFQVSVDGGTTPLANTYTGETTIPQRGTGTQTLEWLKFTVPLQNGTVTVKQTVLGNGTRIHAVKTSNSAAAKGLELWNWGISGALATNWTASSTSIYSGYQTMALHNPDLVFVGVGSNYWALGRTLDTYKADMQALITRLKELGIDVVLVSCHPTAATTGANGNTYTATPTTIAYQRTFVDALQQLATDNGCGFLDTFSRLGTYELLDSLGMAQVSPNPVDGTHIGPLGHWDYADAMSDCIVSL